MQPKAIYFRDLKIENACCFAGRQQLRLADANGCPARWTLLAGENGSGKSSLLQCLAWMRPTPYYPPDNNGEQAGIQPWLHDQDQRVIARLPRKDAALCRLAAEMVAAPDLAACRGATAAVRTGIEIDCRNNEFAGARLTLNEPETTVEPFVVAYAANRWMGDRNSEQLYSAEPVDMLQRGNTELVDATKACAALEYAALKGDGQAKSRLNAIKRTLSDILPFIDEPGDIEIPDPTERRASLVFRTRKGNAALHELGLGHRTVTAWIVDLASRMARRYPQSANPLKEPAVVLIDGIDLHMHPSWQRSLMKQLCEQFTNVQFVATTHSPLMVTSTTDLNVAVLRRGETGRVVIENRTEAFEGWRVDQILVALFGLETGRSLRVEGLMQERAKLIEKAAITPGDQARLNEIAAELAALPMAENSADEEAMRIVRQAAASIRQREHKPQ